MEALEGTVESVHFFAWTTNVEAIEAVENVAGGTPRVRDRLRPIPRLVLSPLAHGVQDWPTGGVECLRHGVVALVGDVGVTEATFVVAVVVPDTLSAPVKLRSHTYAYFK